MLILSLELMFYGLIGVFGALAVLYFAVSIMNKVFESKNDREAK